MPWPTARTPTIVRWVVVVLWALLTITVGLLGRDRIASWSDPTRVTAEVLAWIVWGAGLAALLAGRTRSIGVLRVVVPITAVAAAIAIVDRYDGDPLLATITALHVAAVVTLALSGWNSRACAQGDAYGDEERFPLRVPPALLVLPIPLAIALIAVAVLGGPMLVAADRTIAGVIVLVLGLPLAFLAARSIDGTARRVAVFVPAGLTIVDSFTLAMPVHIPRGDIALVEAHAKSTRREEFTDLRVGAPGGVTITLGVEPAALTVRRGRRQATSETAAKIVIAPVLTGAFLELAAERRVGRARPAKPATQSTSAPPSNASFS